MVARVEDLRPVPIFLRDTDEEMLGQVSDNHLYKPTQYHLTIEKRLLSFNQEETPSR